jgi:hypothetical protein
MLELLNAIALNIKKLNVKKTHMGISISSRVMLELLNAVAPNI